MEIKQLSAEQKEIIKKTLEVSFKVLETAGDPIVADEAKKIQNVINQVLAFKNIEPISNADGHAKSVSKFNESLISKYGLIAARVIEFLLVAGLAGYYYVSM